MTTLGRTAQSLKKRFLNWAWPILSLASAACSIWLLQIKLEAEVAADPAVKAMLDDGALADDMKIISDAIVERLAQIPVEGWLLAGLATLVAYAALAWYDRIALTHIRRAAGISWLYVGASSFVAYALGHNIGASILSGGIVRLRAYTAKGLTKVEVTALIAMCSFTFAYGTVLMLGLVLLVEPEVVAPLGDIAPSLAMLEFPVRLLGGGLVALCLLYVLGSSMRFKPIQIGTLRLEYPSLRVVGRQSVAAPLELLAASAIIYFALPESGNPGYLIVLGAFLIAFSVGLLSQVPGGIGVMEAVFLAVMPQVSSTAVVAALLVWRLLYLLIPLALSGPIIVAFEHSQLHRRKV